MNVLNGEYIKKIRLTKKLGLNETAEKVGISGSYLSNIEKGIKTNPSTEILQKIADTLNVSINEFFDTKDGTKQEINVPEEYTDRYKVTSRDKDQYKEEMKKATEAFFMNDELDEDSKKEMLDLMSELFWKAKALNKRKPKK